MGLFILKMNKVVSKLNWQLALGGVYLFSFGCFGAIVKRQKQLNDLQLEPQEHHDLLYTFLTLSFGFIDGLFYSLVFPLDCAAVYLHRSRKKYLSLS